MFTFRGSVESGPSRVSVKLLQIIFGLSGLGLSLGSETPMEMVMKQFNNNIPKNMIPFTSELKRADNAKKLININGANRNPIYIIDCTFNTFIIAAFIYKSDIIL
jgi:hypothetical protein